MSKGGEFSGVARILFDSAAKSGIVSSNSKKDFAKQLQRLSSQSKKKGGSLGNVVFKMSEFVERELPPIVAPSRKDPTSAKPVPLLNIPLRTRQVPVAKPQETKKVPLVEELKRLELKVPIQQVQGTNAQGTQASSKAHHLAETPKPAPRTLAVPVEPDVAPVSPIAAAQEPQRRRHVQIAAEANDVDDQLRTKFEASATAVIEPQFKQPQSGQWRPVPPSSVPQTESAPSHSLKAAAPVVKAPVVSIFDTRTLATESVDNAFSTASVSLSADDWELQREHEIEQLQNAQRSHEELIAAEALRAQHQELEKAWIKQRSNISTTVRQGSDPYFEQHQRMYFNRPDWELCLTTFGEIVETSRASSAPVDPYAVTLLFSSLRRARNTPLSERVRISVVEMLKGQKNFAELSKALPVTPVTDAQTKGEKPIEDVPEKERRVSAYAKNLTQHAFESWERALQLYPEYTARLSEAELNQGLLERGLLLAFSRRRIPKEARHNVIESLSQVMHKKASPSHAASVALAKAAGGESGRRFLPSPDSSSADESTVAQYIRLTRESEVSAVIATAAKNNINVRDPLIVCAVAEKSLSSNPMRVFDHIAEQATDGVSLTNAHSRVAVLAADVANTTEAAAAAVEVVLKVGAGNPHRVVTYLFGVLSDLKMHDEIISMYNELKQHFDFFAPQWRARFFVNSALKEKGLAPLTQGEFAEGLVRHRRAPAGGEKASEASAAAPSAVSLSQLIPTDVMVEFAKDKKWVSALEFIQRIPDVLPQTEKRTATLLFNCAITAASDDAPVLVENLFDRMKAMKLDVNRTTYNSVMGSFAKTDNMWEKSIAIYESMPVGEKDMNSCSILLQVLSKYGQWTSAISAFDDIRKTPSLGRATQTVYGLAIGATYRHSWSHTLALFQDMLKKHDAADIKDIVVNRVMRSLEDGKKLAEADALEKELQKLKSKGKKKKKN